MEFVILQKGHGQHWPETTTPLVRGQDHYTPVEGFLDTAAVVSCCDLVLSCDTVIGHLAGNEDPLLACAETRAGLAGGITGQTHTLYPTLRLFRQTKTGTA